MERRSGIGRSRRPRRGERAVRVDGDVRVQLRVEPLDSLEIEIDELERGDVAGPDASSLLERRRERELIHAASAVASGRPPREALIPVRPLRNDLLLGGRLLEGIERLDLRARE